MKVTALRNVPKKSNNSPDYILYKDNKKVGIMYKNKDKSGLIFFNIFLDEDSEQ